jgi:DNA-directed RNA polymerase subunit RPC12/RpoP
VISGEDVARIQEELGALSLQAVRIDVDGFIEACDGVASPQALAAGIDPRAVTSAGGWAEMARLLKPFRDRAVYRLAAIRGELAESDEELVPREAACPSCGERRADELALNSDDSVLCATCGRRYSVAGDGGAE